MSLSYDDDNDDWFHYRQQDKEDELYELRAFYGEDYDPDDDYHPSLTAQERNPSLARSC